MADAFSFVPRLVEGHGFSGGGLAQLGKPGQIGDLFKADQSSVRADFERALKQDEVKALAVLYDEVRADSGLYPLVAQLKLPAGDADPTSSACALYLRAGVVARHDTGASKAKEVAAAAVDCGGSAGIEVLGNLLKNADLHEVALSCAGVAELVLSGLSAQATVQATYKALFCIHQLAGARSMQGEPHTLSCAVVHSEALPGLLVRALHRCKQEEKVVRVGLQLVRHLAKLPDVMDACVELQLLQAVKALEYEKFRDGALYSEVESGTLVDGFLHSEAFWLKNVMRFEKDDFRVIGDLVQLLGSADVETVVVALSDLGDFARLHPHGKVVARRNGIKNKALLAMNHPDKRVARAALHTVQKVMLNRQHTEEL